MLAVVKEHLGPGFSVKEVPYPVLRDTDVIIKVRSVGICGSDGPILAGTRTGRVPARMGPSLPQMPTERTLMMTSVSRRTG